MLSILVAARTLMRARLQEITRDDNDRGATAADYSILVGMVAAVIVAVVFTLGQQTGGLYDAAVDALTEAGVSGSAK